MSLEVRITGAAELIDLGRRLKTADKHLDRELRRGLQRAATPLTVGVRAEVPKVMPAGYAPVLSRSLRFRTQTLTSGAIVRISATAPGRRKRRQIGALNRGLLRHPLFGNREFWFNTSVRPGFWSRPMRGGAPTVRRELVRVMSDVKDKITKG